MRSFRAVQFVKDTAAIGGVLALLGMLLLIVQQNEDSPTLALLGLGVVTVGTILLCVSTRFLSDHGHSGLPRIAFAALACVAGIVLTIIAREVSLVYGYTLAGALGFTVLVMVVRNKQF